MTKVALTVLVCFTCVALHAPTVLTQSDEPVPWESSGTGAGAQEQPAEQCTYDDTLIEEAYIKSVKRTLLWKLNLTEPPKNPESPLFVREEQLQEYEAVKAAQEKLNDQRTGCIQSENNFARTIRVFFLQEWRRVNSSTLTPPGLEEGSGTEYVPLDRYEHTIDSYRLKFDVNISDADIVSSAELRLYKTPRAVGDRHMITEERVEVYLITNPEAIGQRYWGHELPFHVVGKSVPSDSEGYVLFDVYEALEHWKDEDQTNLVREVELEINIMCPDGMNPRYTPAIEFDLDSPKLTQLVVRTYQDSRSDRYKRQTSVEDWCRRNNNEFNCCLRELEIDFERDFGWTWVLQPKVFTPNYCRGYCPYNWSPSSLHSLVLSRFIVYSNPTGSPSLCCSPNAFVALPLQFYVNNTVELVTLEDVQVHSCICR